MIRVDGSGIADKFTFLKLLSPRLPVIWELHGFPQESSAHRPSLMQQLTHFKYYLKRRVLSYFVDTVICVSHELESYAKTQMHVRHSVVIPNFIVPSEYRLSKDRHDTALETLSSHFLVCWGGSADLHWQALDLIEQTAVRVHKIDPSILFVVVGSNAWRTPKWHSNILYLSRIPRKNLLQLIKRADICLALYHAPKNVPFYFAPLKILDYMTLHKCIIATDQPSIRRLITNDVNGLLTNNNPADITKKILLLKKHPQYAKKMGNQAHQTAMNRFSIKQATNLYAAALNGITPN